MAPNNGNLKNATQTGGVRYLVAEPFGLCFLGLDGKAHTIYGCPLPQLRELAGLMEILWNEINKEIEINPTISIPEIFHYNSLFQQICLKVLNICKVSPEAVDINMLSQLLFPFQFQGETADGLLMQLNFPQSSSPSLLNSSKSSNNQQAGQSWNDLLASLWISSKNLKDAVDVSEKVPWNQLAPTMTSRNEAYLSPEEKEKRAIAKQFAELTTGKKIDLDVDFDPDNPEGFNMIDPESLGL